MISLTVVSAAFRFRVVDTDGILDLHLLQKTTFYKNEFNCAKCRRKREN